ncbi:MAG: hypothetical protein JWR72_162 [Flavisolibacter sp.]|jgi:hypothetical protein|nr:hypothetical protein [Flavisolibacter sp.]
MQSFPKIVYYIFRMQQDSCPYQIATLVLLNEEFYDVHIRLLKEKLYGSLYEKIFTTINLQGFFICWPVLLFAKIFLV